MAGCLGLLCNDLVISSLPQSQMQWYVRKYTCTAAHHYEFGPQTLHPIKSYQAYLLVFDCLGPISTGAT